MATQGRAAYHKQNMPWPVRLAGDRFARVALTARAEAAIRHLLHTPLGSLWYAPDYGTLFYLLRTQGMNIDRINVAAAHLQQMASKYIPDVDIIDVHVTWQDEEQKLRIDVEWLLKNATAQMHGDLATKRDTTVLV